MQSRKASALGCPEKSGVNIKILFGEVIPSCRATVGVVLLDELVDSGSEFLDSETASVFCG
jgi:hypothetical protein